MESLPVMKSDYGLGEIHYVLNHCHYASQAYTQIDSQSTDAVFSHKLAANLSEVKPLAWVEREKDVCTITSIMRKQAYSHSDPQNMDVSYSPTSLQLISQGFFPRGGVRCDGEREATGYP